MSSDSCPFVDRSTTSLSREEMSDLLRFRHWIPATRGIGASQRDLILVLIRVGVFKKSRSHFSQLEPKMHLQRADQQLDGTWILSFDNGKRKWTHTWNPPVRKQVMEWLENPDYAELNKATPIRYRSTVREVVLLQEKDGADSRTIWASLLPDDSLKISGQDLGPAVERIFGADEYEFAHTIPSEYIHPFLELLGATEVKDVLGALKHFGGPRYPEISAALEQAKTFMPIQFWSWF